MTPAEVNQLYTQIEARPDTPRADKENIKAEPRKFKPQSHKPRREKVDDNFLSRRFRNIARMAPAVLDLVVAMLANPLTGFGVAVKKIAEKAKAETKSDSHLALVFAVECLAQVTVTLLDRALQRIFVRKIRAQCPYRNLISTDSRERIE